MATISESGKDLHRALGPGPGVAAPTIDVATLFGVTGAFAVIGLAMVLGGSPGSFVDAWISIRSPNWRGNIRLR